MNRVVYCTFDEKVSHLAMHYRKAEAAYLSMRDRFGSVGSVFVPGHGNPDSPVVFVGEAPGRQEELLGRPFVGNAGRNLDRLLAGVGMERDEVFITNVFKLRPVAGSRNRAPTAVEVDVGRQWLQQELDIVQPRIVVCLGMSALRAFRPDLAVNLSESCGILVPGVSWGLFLTFHPSPLNYNRPERRRLMESAFERLRLIVLEAATQRRRFGNL